LKTNESGYSLFARQCPDFKFWTCGNAYSAAQIFDLQENKRKQPFSVW
jgi:hypothetical protein